MHCRKSGLTLMELLVAIPMLAVVGVAIAYSLGSSSRLTATQIARVKCQVAASNLMTLMRAAGGSSIFAAHVTGGNLDKNSIAHPDNSINLRVTEEAIPNSDNAFGTIQDLYRLKVEAPDFNNIRSELMMFFP